MGIEIERKFLLKSSNWQQQAMEGVKFRQGYMVEKGSASVRVRIEGDQANLNIKSTELSMRRLEYEYPIPLHEASEMLEKLCLKPLIEKTRYEIDFATHTWEIDVFSAENEGLVVAEIELDSLDEAFERPDWLGDEVTDESRYYNVCLVTHPYKDWT